MTVVGQQPADPSRAVIDQFFLQLGSQGDVDAWIALLDGDVVVDTPFSVTGDPVRFEGLAAVIERFGGARRRMRSLEFLDLETLATEDPERWVTTCRSEGVMEDGSPYANRYCWIFRVRDGRIRGWQEFFDPQQVLAVRRR